LSWQVVILILGIFWIVPFMYVTRWIFMARMYRRASLNREQDTVLADLEPYSHEEPTKRFPAEG